MMESIIKDKVPLSCPTPTASLMAARKELSLLDPTFERSGSTTTETWSPCKVSDKQLDDCRPSPLPRKTTNVIRGFSPGQLSTLEHTTQATASDSSIPRPGSSPAPKPLQLKKQPAKFALRESCSSSEQGHSAENLKAIPTVAAMRPMFRIDDSYEEENSPETALAPPRPASALTAHKEQVPFSNHFMTRMTRSIDQSDLADTEAKYVDEIAINDDDTSDWEDSIEDSGKSSVDEKFFLRVPSKGNLTSRPSLISIMIAQDERAKKLGSHASQSTSAIPRAGAGPSAPSLSGSLNDSDEAPLMMNGMRHPALKPISEIPRSGAKPIAVAANHVHAQVALSPRTTYRNMLATELPESLRRHLSWERQQRSSTANAVLKRRHTPHDVANLKQSPEKPCLKESEEDATRWNQYFSKEALDDYHSKGW